MTYTLKCSCGSVITAPSETRSQNEALAHIKDEAGTHVVTCTRPAHNHPASIGVIVFIANPDKRPRITRYDSQIEIVRIPGRLS